MPKQERVAHFRGELQRRGLPSTQAARAARELADHWEDLRQEALASGMSLEAADAFASEALGDWDELAAAFRSVIGAPSVLRRHPILSFVFAPVFLFVFTTLALLLGVGLTGSAMGWWDRPGRLSGWEWTLVGTTLRAAHFGTLLGVQALFSALAWRYRIG
jgi:hypothetical protein